jgi:hypothetical protein
MRQKEGLPSVASAKEGTLKIGFLDYSSFLCERCSLLSIDNRGRLVGIDWSSTFDLSLSQAEGGGSKYEKIRRNEREEKAIPKYVKAQAITSHTAYLGRIYISRDGLIA